MSDIATPQQPVSLTVEQAMQQAVVHHQSGRLQEAERLYRAILQALPTLPDANHNLGLLAFQVGQPAQGLAYLQTALANDPAKEHYTQSYVEGLLACGQPRQALNILQAAALRGLHLPMAESLRQKASEAAQGLSMKSLTPTPAEVNSLAELGRAGRFTELENHANILVQQYPDAGIIWKMLASSLQAQHKDALGALQKTATLLPNDAEVHGNLGIVLQGLGMLDQAAASYRQALKIAPDFAIVHSNLGNVLLDLHCPDDAVASFRRALKLQPNFADAHINLGNALKQLAKLDDAAASYRRALKINPDFAVTHFNLGVVLQELEQFEAAADSYRRALAIKSDYVEAIGNLGAIQHHLGQDEEALASCRRVLEWRPDDGEAHNNLGAILNQLGYVEEALISCRRAYALKPDLVDVQVNLGIALQNSGNHHEAASMLRFALNNDPSHIVAHRMLGFALVMIGHLDEAMSIFRQALARKPDDADIISNLLFTSNYLCDQPAHVLLDDAKQYGKLVAKNAVSFDDWPNLPKSDHRLRVGLVSGDFLGHPVGYFVEGMLAHIDPSRIELIAYYNRREEDVLTQRIRPYFSAWRSVIGQSDETIANLIHSDGVHLLLDLAGHTACNRLSMFAWKPAPVQASWLGYFATTGLASMDYLIADSWTVPHGQESHFTEKIQRLPETYLCFTAPDFDVAVSPLPVLENGHITFGCFNNLSKMNDAVVALWARILHALPDSRLLLKSKQLGDATEKKLAMERFARHRIDSTRLILEGASPRAELLASYNRVDIALDPFPYPGGTTSVESLWMGVPVLTLAGDRFLSHVGESILHNAGLPEWIANNMDDYVTRATAHARDVAGLSKLRGELRQQVLASPLFNAERFARHFESALRNMWEQSGKTGVGIGKQIA